MSTTSTPQNNGDKEMKQAFLSSAISDISTYIQLSDTKVSIIMAAVVAITAAIFTEHVTLSDAISKVSPCSWIGVSILLVLILHTLSLCCVFLFGILTIRGHSSQIGYKSKWYLPQTTKEYSFDSYKADVLAMTDTDIIENMAAELYKLNDINRQKKKTYIWTLRFFTSFLITLFVVSLLLLCASKG